MATITREEALKLSTLTREEAIDRLVALDVAKWGEGERDASMRIHAQRSRGIAINELLNRLSDLDPDSLGKDVVKACHRLLTQDDWAELRKGG